MTWIADHLWVVPALPLLAAGVSALLPRAQRRLSAALAIAAMGLAFVLSAVALAATLGHAGAPVVRSFAWLQWGGAGETLRLGWVLDPLTALMLVMVTWVGALIFIYSVGYMAHDANFTRFFCFLALFAAAMLGLVIANSLLLLFICWELVGLASYLLIGFWHHKPSAAAAAKKAFITTRIGDLGLFLGMLWLYAETGTLLFYDGGQGCLEGSALARLVAQTTLGGMAVSTAIALLIFCGAIGKSGQVPLHVWLPDAMEGPTPVSALIHAATMVAAGVFLVARVYPLMGAHGGGDGAVAATTALQAVAWVGALTAVFAALIAVAQTDIKRILAYSTVSQLGYMMLGLGVGGVAVGMFHLITHAFFKALLFLGAGSVIHACHEEQDIRRMGGLRRHLPITFATYAIGMMALAGVPVFFAGFWSKDEILHAAHAWPVSQGPFYLGLLGALLTAFYMTRQMCYVFFGASRFGTRGAAPSAPGHAHAVGGELARTPHESPPVMTWPLILLAVGAVLLGFVGTPAWPWFHGYLAGHGVEFDLSRLVTRDALSIMGLSTLAVALGLGLGGWCYGRQPIREGDEPDALESWQPEAYALLRDKFRVDEVYAATVVRWHGQWARWCAWLDCWVWGGVVLALSSLALGVAWLNRLMDDFVVNLGFDQGCRGLKRGGGFAAGLQDGQAHHYLRGLALSFTVLVLLLTWGCRGS